MKRKKASSYWKSRNVKNAHDQPTFLTDSYISITNLLLKSMLTVVIFFIDERNLQKLGLTGELISV